MKKTYFQYELDKTAALSRLAQMEKYTQHGDTTCLLHCIAVAFYSYKITAALRLFSFHESSLIRGALLHDYFLYDWHEKSDSHRMHGFHHPEKARINAEQDFKLNDIEKNIISRHMFPLTITPPKYRESVTVCIVDKICSLREIFSSRPYSNRQILLGYKSMLRNRV